MRERDQSNSSITRVRPFFGELLSRDRTGRTWSARAAGERPRKGWLSAGVLADPGSLLTELVEPRRYRDGVLGTSIEPACFERAVPPSADGCAG